MADRIFKPLVLETKAQLMKALKDGKLKCSKYNLLSEEEKLFVEMLVFGDYTAEQAIRAIKPTAKDARTAANRMLSNKDVADTLEELSIQKDKKFMAELSSARDMALNKLKYIMNTTCDEAVAAACAKTILDKAEKIIVDSAKNSVKDDKITDIKFSIKVDNMVVNPRAESRTIVTDGFVEVDLDLDDQSKSVQEKMTVETQTEQESTPFTIIYEGIDNYNDNSDD